VNKDKVARNFSTVLIKAIVGVNIGPLCGSVKWGQALTILVLLITREFLGYSKVNGV
jgi:hypothetical protein